MIFIIKPEYIYSYPANIRTWSFRFISASIHPQLFYWTLLLAGADGELYVMKKDHVKLSTPLEMFI
jgi:hypothetical protein